MGGVLKRSAVAMGSPPGDLEALPILSYSPECVESVFSEVDFSSAGCLCFKHALSCTRRTE
jgi:hypothetical protein